MNMLPAFLQQKENRAMPDNPSLPVEDDPEARQFFNQIRALRQENQKQGEIISSLQQSFQLEKEKNRYLQSSLAEAEKKRDRYQGLYSRLLSAIHHIEAAIELAREEARKVEPFGAPSGDSRPKGEPPLSREDEAALRDIIQANTGGTPNVGG